LIHGITRISPNLLELKGLYEVGRRGSPPECLIAAVEADPLEPHADVGIAAEDAHGLECVERGLLDHVLGLGGVILHRGRHAG